MIMHAMSILYAYNEYYVRIICIFYAFDYAYYGHIISILLCILGAYHSAYYGHSICTVCI